MNSSLRLTRICAMKKKTAHNWFTVPRDYKHGMPLSVLVMPPEFFNNGYLIAWAGCPSMRFLQEKIAYIKSSNTCERAHHLSSAVCAPIDCKALQKKKKAKQDTAEDLEIHAYPSAKIAKMAANTVVERS